MPPASVWWDHESDDAQIPERAAASFVDWLDAEIAERAAESKLPRRLGLLSKLGPMYMGWIREALKRRRE